MSLKLFKHIVTLNRFPPLCLSNYSSTLSRSAAGFLQYVSIAIQAHSHASFSLTSLHFFNDEVVYIYFKKLSAVSQKFLQQVVTISFSVTVNGWSFGSFFLQVLPQPRPVLLILSSSKQLLFSLPVLRSVDFHFGSVSFWNPEHHG